MKHVHNGAWADDANTAIGNAFAEVGIDPADYGIMLTYGDDLFALHPHDATLPLISGHVTYSEPRDMWRATIRR